MPAFYAWRPEMSLTCVKPKLSTAALPKLGLDRRHRTPRVKGIGSGYWRVVADVEELIDKGKEISRRTLRWYWLCADFEQDLARQRRIILPRLRLRVLGVEENGNASGFRRRWHF